MIYNGFTQYPMTALLRKYTVTQDGDTTIRNYYDGGTVSIRLMLTDLRSFVVYSKDVYNLFERFSGIKDAAGVEVLPGAVFEIKARYPVINPFGFADGYSYKVSITEGA